MKSNIVRFYNRTTINDVIAYLEVLLRKKPPSHVIHLDILARTSTVQEHGLWVLEDDPVMWNSAGVSVMGGRLTASWVFCRGELEPMPGADRTRAQASSMHANQPVRRARVEGICRGSLPWIQRQSHDII